MHDCPPNTIASMQHCCWNMFVPNFGDLNYRNIFLHITWSMRGATYQEVIEDIIVHHRILCSCLSSHKCKKLSSLLLYCKQCNIKVCSIWLNYLHRKEHQQIILKLCYWKYITNLHMFQNITVLGHLQAGCQFQNYTLFYHSVRSYWYFLNIMLIRLCFPKWAVEYQNTWELIFLKNQTLMLCASCTSLYWTGSMQNSKSNFGLSEN